MLLYTNKIEGDVNYEVIPMGEKVKIKVKNIETSQVDCEIYVCQYPIICGYDIFDYNEVEKILEKLINAVK